MIEYYYLLFLILPLTGYIRYRKYIDTAIKTLCVMYVCKPTSPFVKKIDNNTYQLTFRINSKSYSFMMKLNNGPNRIEKITNGDTNITKEVEPYFNFNDLHIYSSITPGMLGYNNISIEYFNGDDKLFNCKDNILDQDII